MTHASGHAARVGIVDDEPRHTELCELSSSKSLRTVADALKGLDSSIGLSRRRSRHAAAGVRSS